MEEESLIRDEMNYSQSLVKHTGENDDEKLPVTSHVLDWEYFNNDYKSTPREFEEVAEICAKFATEKVDLRPYY